MKLRKLFIILIATLMIIFLLLLSMVFFYKSSDLNNKIDVIVILGHSLKENSLPSDWLTARLDDGFNLYKNDIANKIIVSGGKGPKDNIAVCESMKRYLILKGVNVDDIITEDNARNTYENFVYVKKIADENNFKNIVVVTNDFHMFRSMFIANNFFKNPKSYYSNLKFDKNKFFAYVKEPFSIIKYFFISIFS